MWGRMNTSTNLRVALTYCFHNSIDHIDNLIVVILFMTRGPSGAYNSRRHREAFMNQPTDVPTPPEDFPPDLAAELQESSVHDLREAIIYAQELLRSRHQPTLQIEPGPGEELVRLTERSGYTEVVKRQPCGDGCEDCPHGPYVYHVTREQHPDGSERLHWTLIGREAGDVD